ncbi:hypothetical protein COO60DRAFT_19013 [Scenedesmus sp. NREL 46B-D3]|nr:hypothetical protein COO60DRAFT_19013 [Scenedesmus sp. NREL 46B-D3]
MERLDFGASTKYYPNPSLGLGVQRHPKQQQHYGKQQQFSLVSLNPHAHALGLQAQDFTPSKLTAGILSAADAAATPAAASTAEQPLSDHQLLAAYTPGLPAPDSDAVAARDEVEDDAIAAAETGEGPGVQQAQQAQQQQNWGGPAFQFVLGSSSSDEADEEEADEAEERSAGVEQEQKLSNTSKAGAGAAAAPAAAFEQAQLAAEGAARRKRRRSTAAAAAAATAEDDEGVIVLGSSSDDGGSSGNGSEGDAAREELAADGGGSEDDDVDDSFIPLLPSPSPAAKTAAAAAAAGGNSPAAADAAAASEGRTPGFQPPWLPRLRRFDSPLLRLHNEVVAFCKMLEPTAEEVASRARSMRTVREVVHSIWPQAEVLVFGSYETGLYTPASDTDIVVCGAGLNDPTIGLKALAHALTQRQLVRNMQQVLTARVPIIKFEMLESGLAFDVAWEQRSGPAGAALVRQMLAGWPVMKPLVLVLKVFLTQRELNEVYAGGLGSYSLIIMVAAFLQLHPSRRPAAAAAGGGGRKRARSMGGADAAGALEANLGLLLVDFMRLFGRALNMSEVGVTCADGGCFYSKAARGFLHPTRDHLLSVQDPLDAANDTAANSWNIKTVRQVFDHAYQLLTAPCAPGESLLGRIIHLAPVVAGRPEPPWLHKAPRRSGGKARPGSGSSRRHSSAGGSGRTGGDRDGQKERGRSRDRASRGGGRRMSSASKGGGSRLEPHHQQQQRSGSKGGGDSSSEKQQRQQETPGSAKLEKKKKRQQRGQDGAQGSSSGTSKVRDAAGRAGAAAGDSTQYGQQQQRSHGKSPEPERKRQRR